MAKTKPKLVVTKVDLETKTVTVGEADPGNPPGEPETTADDVTNFEVGETFPPERRIVGRLYGILKDPVTRFGHTFFHMVTATIDEDGEVIETDVSEQSWFIWETLHKIDRALAESIIDIQKTPEIPK